MNRSAFWMYVPFVGKCVYTLYGGVISMKEITEDEVLSAIRENPMICTRALVKKLRPEEFRDLEAYKGYLCAL